MRNGFALALCGMLAGAGLATGQQVPPPPDAAPLLATGGSCGAGGCGVEMPCCAPECSAERLWFQADYLMWWIRKGPLPTPLVSTGPLTDAFPGALDQPNTTVLFGGSDLDYDMFSGLRLAGGIWLDREANWGVEASWFLLETRSEGFGVASDATGTPFLARPFLRANTGNENVYFVSLPGVMAGGVLVNSSTTLWGWDVNGVANVVRREGFRANALAGFRSLDLREDLSIREDFAQLAPGLNAAFFNGAEVNPPGSLSTFDYFRTNNRFYGPQVGGRADWDLGSRLTVGVLAKVALGVTDQEVAINGGTTLLGPGGPVATLPGGILAQTTNIGTYSRTEFAVVPEVGLNLGVKITERVQARVGYTFLYWSNVVRPGNQVDRAINTNIVPTDIDFGAAGGPARPAFVVQDTDFWAQGVNLGLEFKY